MTSAAVIAALVAERERIFAVIAGGDADIDAYAQLDQIDDSILFYTAENRGVVLSEHDYGPVAH